MPDSSSNNSGNGSDVSRRSFLKGVSTGVVSSAVIPGIAAAKERIDKAVPQREGDTEGLITLTVNGRKHNVYVEARTTLAAVLREKVGLTGTKVGCDSGECGCCSVIMDGKLVYSCMTLAMDADGSKITTIEGVSKNGELSPVQQAFIEHDAYQCGFCTPGQIVAATALIKNNPNPSEEEIKHGLSGNLCRCGAYQHIIDAVTDAAGKMRR